MSSTQSAEFLTLHSPWVVRTSGGAPPVAVLAIWIQRVAGASLAATFVGFCGIGIKAVRFSSQRRAREPPAVLSNQPPARLRLTPNCILSRLSPPLSRAQRHVGRRRLLPCIPLSVRSQPPAHVWNRRVHAHRSRFSIEQ